MKDDGVWLVYYPDFSGFAVFDSSSELEALRYAVEHKMDVRWLVFGKDPRD